MIYGSQAHGQMIVRDVRKHAPKPHSSVADALEDDLNTPEAITALRALFKNRDDPETYCSLIETSEFLGLFHITTIGAYSRGVVSKNLGADRTFPLHDKIEALKVALINQDSDQLRTITDQIADVGISVDIHPGGSPTLKPQAEDKADTGGEIERLIEARNEARKTKNFKESDRIRDELAAKGIVLKDGPSGTTWEVKR
jgi:cysteinyl-tRNA synthetase